MTMVCWVPGCYSNSSSEVFRRGYVTVFSFPKAERRKALWTSAIGRTDAEPSKSSVVCIKHFEDRFIVRESRATRPDGSVLCVKRSVLKLTEDAVPTIFQSPPKRNNNKKKRKCPSNQKAVRQHQVEFKPEMWEDKDKPKDTPEVKKRGRGRPRKIKITDENTTVNGNTTSLNGSSEMLSESVPCCALACPNTSDTHVMNRLPKGSSLRQQWIQNIDRLAWTADNDSALCEIHFDSEMWDHNVGGEKSLKHDAVPTLCLHGEAIKSWVTLDNTGQVKKVDIKNQENGDENELVIDLDESKEDNDEQMDEDERDLFVKHEALEPEIDMVEGSEDVLSQDSNLARDPFETIFCDTSYPDDQQDLMISRRIKQDNGEVDELEDHLGPEDIYVDENYQSEISDKSEDTLDVNILEVKSLQGEKAEKNKFEVISEIPRWKIRRRSSSQLTNQYQCAICNRRLSRKKNLEIHIQKLHPNGELTENQKWYKVMKDKEDGKLQQKRQCYRVIAPAPTPPPSQAVKPHSPLSLIINPVPAEDSHSPTTVVTSPRPLDPSPAGGEMKKQFLLLVPKPLPEMSPPPSENLSFSVNLASVPAEKRLALRLKLKELVDAVVHKNLNPERIIIAYDRT